MGRKGEAGRWYISPSAARKVGDLKGTAAEGGRNAGGRIKGNEDKQSVCLKRLAFSEYVCVSDGETWSHVYANLPLGAASNMSVADGGRKISTTPPHSTPILRQSLA
jgi:hypothetical protein